MAPPRRKPTSHRSTPKLGSFRGKLTETGSKRDAPDDDEDDQLEGSSNKRPRVTSTSATQDDVMEDDEAGDFGDDDTGAMEDLDLGEDRGSFGEDYSGGGLDAAELTHALQSTLDNADGGDNVIDFPHLDLQELQQRDQYQEPAEDVDENVIPTCEFDEVDIEAEQAIGSVPVTPGSMLPPYSTSRRSSKAKLEDTSELIIHDRVPLVSSKFKLALGLFANNTGMSRSEYTSLREILQMLGHNEISDLPRSVTTLKNQVIRQLPLLDMRKKSIPLIPEKLATETATRKSMGIEDGIPHEDLHFFDPSTLFKAFLSSDIAKKMHMGFGEFRDEPTELWHARCWLSSVRTTSGKYAHYPDGEPIFPSDFVTFRCMDTDCKCSQQDPVLHFGRVFGVGRYFNTAGELPEGSVALEMQEVFRFRDLPEGLAGKFTPPVHESEAILNWSTVFYIPEAHVIERFDVDLDYGFGEDKQKLPQVVTYTPGFVFFIRRQVDDMALEFENMQITPLCRLHPLRAELELKEYGRGLFRDKWDISKGNKCMSVPILTFIDGFGLYRNSYRSLMGYYAIIASLNFQDRNRRQNVLPITLGPHGSNLDDVILAMQSLVPLEEGMPLDINGVETTVSVFTLCFIGDMPQQQWNSGFKTQRANRGCRFCFIDETDRGNLDFDVLNEGRYHYQAVEMRKEMNSLRTKDERNKYGTQWGLAEGDEPALATISPALDLIITRPSDPPHSEFGGISRMMHETLIEAILTPKTGIIYSAELRKFPFPPGWSRLQAPLHHLKSYSLSDHARWSIVAPLLLRGWLEKKYIATHFWNAASVDNTDVVSYIVSCFAAVAKSNSVLMASSVTAKDRSNTQDIILKARNSFQSLCGNASRSIVQNPRSRVPTPQGSRPESRAPSPAAVAGPAVPAIPGTSTVPAVPVVKSIKTAEDEKKARAIQYNKDAKKPNVHMGLHYGQVAEEYGLPANINVLIGEDKHRWYKKIIYQTNHSNVEQALLKRENIQQTVRLLLAKAFQHSDPGLTTTFNDLYRECPSMLQQILPRSEVADYSELLEEDESELALPPDGNHSRPAAIGCIQPKYAKDVLQLPMRTSQMSENFRKQFTTAFEIDYGMEHIMEFGKAALQWSTKVAFNDKTTERRYVFAIGSHLEFREQQIGRIDAVFVHELNGVRRLFVKMTELHYSGVRDQVLDLPLVTLGEELIIGLPSIAAKKLYIVGLEKEDTTVVVDWSVQFL